MKQKAFLIDCMGYMATLKDGEFDLAVVDPPYGISVTKMNMGNHSFGPDKSKSWDDSVPGKDYFDELMRVSKNQVIWGGNYFDLPQSQYFMVWDKGETMYGRDFPECELAWVSSGGTRIFKIGPNQKNRIHPTQKPVELYEAVYKKYSKPGFKILDTHLGSGSSRIAAYNMGLEFVGLEVDNEYFSSQEDRFKNHVSQGNLFGDEILKNEIEWLF